MAPCDPNIKSFKSQKSAIRWANKRPWLGSYYSYICRKCGRWHIGTPPRVKVADDLSKQVAVCRSKIAYDTLDLAQKEAERLDEIGEYWVMPYVCPICGKYHVGHASLQVRESELRKQMEELRYILDEDQCV